MTATARDVIVSDHAVLRWLERVEGFDVEALRKRLGEAARIGLRHGAAGVLLGAGRLVLRDCVVVTTLRREHVRVDLIGAAQIEIDLLVDAPRRRRRRRR